MSGLTRIDTRDALVTRERVPEVEGEVGGAGAGHVTQDGDDVA